MLKIKHELDWDDDLPDNDSKYVIVIGFHKDKILMILNDEKGRGFEFPGGLVEPGEEIKETAIRELEEESGLRNINICPVLEIENTFSQRLGLTSKCYVFSGDISSIEGMNKDCHFLDQLPANTTFDRSYYLKLLNIITTTSKYSDLNKKCWNSISPIYENSNFFDIKDFHYGPMIPGDSKINLLGDIKGKKILDLGCGLGHNSCYLAKNGGIVTAIDFSEIQINYASQLSKEQKLEINFLCTDISSLDIKNDKFDIIVSVFSLQFINDMDKLVNQLKVILNDNGLLILSLKHPDSFGEDDYKINNWVQEGLDGDNTFIVFKHTLNEIEKLLQAKGFDILNVIEPLPADNIDGIPYHNKYFLEKVLNGTLGKYTLIIKAIKGRTNN